MGVCDWVSRTINKCQNYSKLKKKNRTSQIQLQHFFFNYFLFKQVFIVGYFVSCFFFIVVHTWRSGRFLCWLLVECRAGCAVHIHACYSPSGMWSRVKYCRFHNFCDSLSLWLGYAWCLWSFFFRIQVFTFCNSLFSQIERDLRNLWNIGLAKIKESAPYAYTANNLIANNYYIHHAMPVGWGI